MMMMMILAGDLVWHALWYHTSDDHLASCDLEDRLESRGNNLLVVSWLFVLSLAWFLQLQAEVMTNNCLLMIFFVLATAGSTSFKPCAKVGRQRH